MLSPAAHRFAADAASDSPVTHRTVAVFAEYFPPYIGSDRRLFHLVENLQRWRPEYLITPPLRVITRRCEPALLPYAESFRDSDSTVYFGGIRGSYLSLPRFIHHLYTRGGLRLQLAYALSIPMLVRKALRRIEKMRPAAIVVGHPSFITGVVGILCAKLARLPVLLDYPDAWTPLAVETSGHRGKWIPKVMRYIERFVARRPNRITCITHLLAKSVRDDGATAPIAIVPNGVDLRNFPERNGATRTSGSFRVLYSGRLEKWAGTDDLVGVIDRVCSRIGHRAHFMFVGDGGGASDLRRDIAARDLDRYCTFFGFQPYEAMSVLLAKCDLAVLPFPDTETTRVSLPCKIFEYMAMGKPVIAADLPGIREVMPDQAAIWIKDITAEALAEKIIELERDPRHCDQLAEAGYRVVRSHFSWELLSTAFEKELDILSPRPIEKCAPALELVAS
ncbi:MAG: glycosyltransferase family 4 protein [Candidatus Eremiobacteraeota bacterium]|nr:glycosyltransferase family 4 protein [Candidatus Eremiobacteraeota bacterium]